MIKLNELLTTQSSVRNMDQIHGMAEFIRSGGIFNRQSLDYFAKQSGKKAAPLIQINRFEDGIQYILDGHHRAIGVLEGGRDYFDDTEYQIIDYTYKEFTDIVFTREDGSWMGWVTPFDPRTQIRLAETKAFKDRVMDIYKTQSPQHATHYILTCKHEYLRERKALTPPVNTVKEIRDYWLREGKSKRVA